MSDIALDGFRFGMLLASGIVLSAFVFVKFATYAKDPAKQRQVHPVATLSMTAFLIAMFPLLVRKIGAVQVPPLEEQFYLAFGAALMLLGVRLHIAGKLEIGSHWSDQIEAAAGQSFVSSGVYSLTRHPMYSSLIMWILGAALAFVNPLVFGLVTVLFVPMMLARARAEEKLLAENVEDPAAYEIYRQRTNIMIPRFGGLPAFALRVVGILVYGFFIGNFTGTNFTPAGIVFLVVMHLALGFTILPEKAAFSYKSKTGMMVLVWFLTMLWQPIYYLHWFFLLMYVYGLFFNCPCMFAYEKYHGCPCFGWMKRACGLERR